MELFDDIDGIEFFSEVAKIEWDENGNSIPRGYLIPLVITPSREPEQE